MSSSYTPHGALVFLTDAYTVSIPWRFCSLLSFPLASNIPVIALVLSYTKPVLLPCYHSFPSLSGRLLCPSLFPFFPFPSSSLLFPFSTFSAAVSEAIYLAFRATGAYGVGAVFNAAALLILAILVIGTQMDVLLPSRPIKLTNCNQNTAQTASICTQW